MKKNSKQLLLIAITAGIGYYFFIYLSNKRTEAIQEIKTMFQNNPTITVNSLDSNLWVGKENWEEYLDNCYFSSQINLFVKQMKKAITEKVKESEERENGVKEERKKAISELKGYCKRGELESPAFKKIIKEYSKKINQSEISDISSLQKEANELIIEERVKKQGLHWRRKLINSHSWADNWLNDNIQTFEQAWAKMTDIMKREPERFNIAASYKIKFPPSLWNSLTDEQKAHKKAEELILGDDVPTYKFNKLIEDWENKTKFNPIRGERDPDTKLDNNALFYGAPRTGKSVMAEKLAYEADKYPLVVIQGSSLTPKDLDYKSGIDPLGKFIFTLCDIDHTLVDDFGFEREDNGEVRHILFVDEANQITTSTLISKSTQLTFLKECMGSDTGINESKNLWIMATNHLDQVNPAVYQPGRLSNPLDFSWTLGDFMRYATDAGITINFPNHWLDDVILNDEDNKWMNRFNKMYFDNDFLPFWNKFIDNEETKKILDEQKEDKVINEESGETEETVKQKGIQWGEFLEFFWRLFDSKQLEHFNGKFITPRKPKIEEVVVKASNQISTAIDTHLKELLKMAEQIKENSQGAMNSCTSAIEDGLEQINQAINEK